MVAVTVTGGLGKPNITLGYDNGARNIAEAQSIAGMVTGKFASTPAAYDQSTPNAAGSDGYLVVTQTTPLLDTRGYQAITFAPGESATVMGGAAGGQSVLGGGSGLDFIANYGGTLLDLSAGTNTFQDMGTTGSTIYGGSGGDTYDVGGADTIFAGSGSTQVNLTGAGFISLTSGSGSISVSGGSPGAAASTIMGGSGTLNLILGSGNFSVIGGTGGANTIIGGTGNETLVGGSNGDFIQAGSGNTSLIAGTGAEVLVAGSGSDTLVASTGSVNTTILNLANVSDTSAQHYLINNFNPSAGSSGDNIYVANTTDVSLLINSAHNDGSGNVVATLNGGGGTFTLANTTLVGSGASATINGQNFASHIKSAS